MPNRRRLNVVDRAAEITAARAGIIFESDHIAAELLAATSSITRGIRAYLKSATSEKYDHAIVDMLVDLRHYCNSRGLVFDELNAAAEERYWDEKAALE